MRAPIFLYAFPNLGYSCAGLCYVSHLCTLSNDCKTKLVKLLRADEVQVLASSVFIAIDTRKMESLPTVGSGCRISHVSHLYEVRSEENRSICVQCELANEQNSTPVSRKTYGEQG